MLKLCRAPDPVVDVPDLDDVQRAAVAHRGGVLRVVGGPGTGKTTVAVETVVDRVDADGLRPDQCLVLAPSRLAAGALREQVTARLGGTSTEPLARSHQSFAFGILRQDAALRGDPAPRLLSGPEQDVILRELLAGHASGEGKAPQWPESVQAALGTRGLRTELRDLLMRAVERGLEAADLARLGRQHERPEWVAAAQVLAEYDEVTAFSRPGAFDPAWILGAAADRLEDDSQALDRARAALRLVVVDDAQELTPAAARLLEVVVDRSIDLVLIGDPDVAVQGFRGADPRLFMQWGAAGAAAPTSLVLPTSYRLPEELHAVAARVSRRIGAVGSTAHRAASPRAAATGPEPRARVALLRTAAQEAGLIAAELRRAHLIEGVPWSQMAVIVRGQGRTGVLRRILGADGVPVAVASTQAPVRDEVAVRPLLALLGVVLRAATGQPEALPADVAVDVLQSPIGGADAVAVRRLRRALRRAELDGGGARTSDELLAEALLRPEHLLLLGPEAAPARRVAAVVAAGVDAAAVAVGTDGTDGTDGTGGLSRWAPGVTAESVLWAMWQASGLAGPWTRTALGGGPAGARADRDLDAVLALFDAAGKYVDRLPQMGPAGFLEHIQGQDVAEDTLGARAPTTDAVALLTAQAAAGRQWRRVVVAGVQEGVWPDLRLRGSLLGSERLVDVLTGRGHSLRAAQAAVRYDETRQFLMAVTRASERLLVTAVRSDEEQPSVYLDLVDPPDERDDGEELRPFAQVHRPMTLASMVGELRRDVVTGADDQAAAQLAALADAGVPGADPRSWWPLIRLSDDRPLRPPDAPVTVSPSKVEAFGDCGLRWLLSACGGDGPGLGAANVGTLVHDIAAELGDVDAESLRAEVDSRWGRLGLPSGWLSERQRGLAHDMVGRLARYFEEAEASGWLRLGAEVDLEVTLGRAVLRGRVDRLEADGEGRLRVIDLKTGSTKPTAADLARHPQLGAYQVAVEEGAFTEHGNRSAGAALLQLGKAAGKATTLQLQSPLAAEVEEPQWAHDLLRATAEGMSAGVFTARVGDGCRVCAVRSSCPVQPEGERL